jgi:hypothetical protein
MLLKDNNAFLGYMELLPGDYIFARDMQGSEKPEDDVVQAWLTDQ